MPVVPPDALLQACSLRSKHSTGMKPHIAITDLTVSVDTRMLVRNLNLEVPGGTLLCILGTNGVGKTLTLHTLAGLRPADTGEIAICGHKLEEFSRRELARRLGLLLQIHDDGFPVSVMERALMGRYPHLGLWQWAQAEDRQLAQAALHEFDLSGLESRNVMTLSGGERERLALATLHVQDPAVWLLDEPMNHLDPHHQLDVMRTLQARARAGRVVISTVHNPAMAMRFADQVLLLYGDGEWESGPTSRLMEPARLERLYQTPFTWYRSDGSPARNMLLPA